MPINLTCSSICFRSLPVAEALREIRSFGFRTVELAVIPGFCPHFTAATASEAETDAFVATVLASGLRVASVVSVPGDLNAPGVDGDAVYRAAAANIRLAKRLGAPRICLRDGQPVGNLDDRSAFDENLAQVLPGLFRQAALCADAGLKACFEAPHRNGLCRTLDEAQRFLNGFDKAGFTDTELLLDVTHVQAGGASPIGALSTFGGRIGNVHLRDGKGENIFFVPGTGDIDFGAFLNALDKVQYQGLCGMELEGHGETLQERRDGLQASLQHVRQCAVGTSEKPGPGLQYAL